MDIDYRLWLQELAQVELDNQAEIWAVMTEMTYEEEMELSDEKILSPLYDDEF